MRKNTLIAVGIIVAHALLTHDAILAGQESGLLRGDSVEQTPVSASRSADSCSHYWCSFLGGGFVSVGYTVQDGPGSQDPFHGLRLTWGGWGQDRYRFGLAKSFPDAGGFHFWISRLESRNRKLWNAGLGADLSFFAFGPCRLFANPQLGIAHRPDGGVNGWGPVLGAGLGAGIFLGHHAQVVFVASEDFYFVASPAFRTSIELRFLTGKIPFPIAD